MDLGLPSNVTTSVEDLARELAKHNMAADIKISKGEKHEKHDHKKGKDDDGGMCKELKGLLESWDDRDHPYYKDVEKLVYRHDDKDEEVESEDEYIEEE